MRIWTILFSMGVCALLIGVINPFTIDDYNGINITITEHKEGRAVKKGNDSMEGYEERFFLELLKVIKTSENIEINDDRYFDEIYKELIPFFREKYTKNIGLEGRHDIGNYIQSVQELIKNKYRGVCDDYSLFLYVLAKKKGLKVRYAIGYKADEKGKLRGHAWIQIYKEGKWIDYNSTLDEICDGCVSKKYFKHLAYFES